MTAHTFFLDSGTSFEQLKFVQQQAGSAIATLKQVHSTIVHPVTSGSECLSSEVAGDGLLTTDKNICLVVKTADCLPILFSHSGGVIGAVHAGRRGTQNGVIEKALEKAIEVYGVDGGGFQFWLGPAICANCYQVDREQDLYFDLVTENLRQITTTLGHTPHVELSNICTLETPTYNSYRRSTHTGNSNYSGIVLQ